MKSAQIFSSSMDIFHPAFPQRPTPKILEHITQHITEMLLQHPHLHSSHRSWATSHLPSPSNFLCCLIRCCFTSPHHVHLHNQPVLLKEGLKATADEIPSVMHKEKDTDRCLQTEHRELCREGKQASLLVLLGKCLFSVSKCVTGN